LPRSGASYHALREAFGPFVAFMQAWIMILISGPGAIAGVAILFGEFANRSLESSGLVLSPIFWAVMAIFFFTIINLRGAALSGGTQVLLTVVKITGLIALIVGALFFADPIARPNSASLDQDGNFSSLALFQFIGAGVAIVLFTYDGWIDASNVAGEVRNPNRNFPLAMGAGVIVITCIYLLVNYAFLQVVTLAMMREQPATVAATVAIASFGKLGGEFLNVFIWISIFGALGGLIMTLPRLYYAAASEYQDSARGTLYGPFFKTLSYLSPKTGVPAGAIMVSCVIAVVVLMFFGSFSRIVTFFVVPFQCINMLMIATIFKLRPRLATADTYRSPFYPLLPVIYIFVMSLFMLVSLIYNPLESLIGILLTLVGIPVYLGLSRKT
jgi:APA family basic amino acid/polyamine antiporter